MPRGDRTGPNGMGAMTGRAAGFCAGNSVPGYMNPGPGQGFYGWGSGGGRGGGRGWGRGYGNRFYATGPVGWQAPAWGYTDPVSPRMTEEQEMGGLKAQADYLKDELSGIQKRIEELNGEKNK